MSFWNDRQDNPNAPQLRKRNVDLYKLINLSPKAPRTKDEIIKAGKLWLIYGNYERVAREMKLSPATVRYWGARDWWPILLEELKYLKNIELDGTYTRALDKSLRELIERLDNGDEVVNTKTGEKYRKKVSARDAALIAAMMHDKRALLRGDPTQIADHNFNVSDRMNQLQDMFDTIAKKADEKVIEGTATVVKEEAVKTASDINNAINLPFQQKALGEN